MQSRVYDQAGYVIHRREYRDTSLILDVITEQHGRLSLLARGGRKSRNRSCFQPCNRLLLGWSGHSELKTLTQIECHNLAISPRLFAVVLYLNELLLYLMPKHEPHPDLFEAYQYRLLEMSRADFNLEQLEPLLREFEMTLLTGLGLLPDLSIDHTSGELLLPDEQYAFDVHSGLHERADERETAFLGADLIAIQQRCFDSPVRLAAAKRLMRQIIDFNLYGRTLQSRQFYRQITSKS